MSVNIGNLKHLKIHIKKQAKLILIVCLTNIKILPLQHVINIKLMTFYICHNKSSKSISIIAQCGHYVFSGKVKCTPIQTLRLFLMEACYPTSVFKFNLNLHKTKNSVLQSQ